MVWVAVFVLAHHYNTTIIIIIVIAIVTEEVHNGAMAIPPKSRHTFSIILEPPVSGAHSMYDKVGHSCTTRLANFECSLRVFFELSLR